MCSQSSKLAPVLLSCGADEDFTEAQYPPRHFSQKKSQNKINLLILINLAQMNFKCPPQQSITCRTGVLLGLQVAVEGEENWTGNIGNRVLETKRTNAGVLTLYLKYSLSI